MSRFTIEIPGRPVPLQRARNFRAKDGRALTVDTEENRVNKAFIRSEAVKVCRESGFSLPLPTGEKGYRIEITSYFRLPSSLSRKNREYFIEHDVTPKVKPDADNIAKLFLDALKGVIQDDRMVSTLKVEKRYTEDDRERTVCSVYFGEEEIWKKELLS